MSPRTLLGTGVGLLLLGLLLVLGIDCSGMDVSQQAVVVQGYLSHVCSFVGAGLVVVAALVSALRGPRPTVTSPEIDHYS